MQIWSLCQILLKMMMQLQIYRYPWWWQILWHLISGSSPRCNIIYFSNNYIARNRETSIYILQPSPKKVEFKGEYNISPKERQKITPQWKRENLHRKRRETNLTRWRTGWKRRWSRVRHQSESNRCWPTIILAHQETPSWNKPTSCLEV